MRPTKGGALQAPTHPHPADQLLVLQSDMRDHPYRDHKATDKEITLVRQVQATVEMTLPSVAAPLVRGERVAAHLGHLHTTLLKNIMTGHDLDPGHVQGHGGGRGRDRGRAPVPPHHQGPAQRLIHLKRRKIEITIHPKPRLRQNP